MDQKLLAWGRAVKARRPHGLPPLWLFTDSLRLPAVEAAVAGLPRGLCGVVFRHDGDTDRGAVLARVRRLCRSRRLALVVAGTACGAPVGRHLRRGFGRRGRARLLTSSAHGPAELARARRAGALVAFLSPVFRTASHPAARPLGPVRWAALARRARIKVFALGGVTGASVKRLPRWTEGAGAIGALAP